ncbi:MAG: AMP-binding protein [Rhizobiales bacterium]|nr:AMP-binding protein [Hyphomicrobiales bacterium]
MILVSESQQQAYLDAGLWSQDSATHSLDGLLRAHAVRIPDATALADSPDRNAWTSGDPRRLSWADLDRAVTAFARFLNSLDLPPDAVIALYGAQTSDMVISLLAVHRAGFIAAPIPLYWREAEMRDYLTEIQARVIIVSDRVEADLPALRCRDLAQSLFSVKFIMGFGDFLPDGVVDLDTILPAFAENADAQESFVPIDPNAIVSVHPCGLQSRDTEIVLPRSSNQWLAAERALFGAINNERDNAAGSVLTPFSLSGLAGFLAGFIHALRHGKTLHLHHFRSLNTLNGHIDLVKPGLVLVPKSLLDEANNRLSVHRNLIVAAVWKNDHLRPQPVSGDQPETIFDITIINEITAFGSLRPNGAMVPEPLSLNAPGKDIALHLRGANNGRVRQPQKIGGGELIATGAAIPEFLFPSNSEKRALARLRNKKLDDGVHTHVACRVTNEAGTACEPIGFLINTVSRSSQVVAADELDDLYKSVPNVADAAHFIDPNSGSLNVAVVGVGNVVPSPDEFRDALIEMGVSPLKLPEGVYRTNAIKRGVGDLVIRHELAALIAHSETRRRVLEMQQALG